MAVPVKAPVGQRVVTAFITLFCVLAIVALFGSGVLASWYGVVLAVVVLGAACVFGYVTVRGCLPGHFRAGGNAFIGSRKNADTHGAYRSTPIWQRAFCGALAAGSGIAIVAGLVRGYRLGSYEGMASLVAALGGFYLFGYIALRGHLPGPHRDGGNAAFNRHSRRGSG